MKKDSVMWSLILLMFFLMAKKSNLVPDSISSFDNSKQLIVRDIQCTDNMLIVTIKWSKTRQFGTVRHKFLFKLFLVVVNVPFLPTEI